VPLEARFEELKESMGSSKVDRAMVLTSYTVNEHRPSTKEVVELTKDDPSISVVAGMSFLKFKERDLREESEYMAEGLVKGLKRYPGYEPFYPYDSRCRILYEMALEYDVPVMIHSGDPYSPRAKVRFAQPLAIDDVAVDFPDLKLLICHVGNPWIRDCMEVVYKNTNVHADISGLVLGDFTARFEKFMVEQVKDMVLYAGDPNYLLYGTDWPICRMRTYLKFVRSLDLSEVHDQKIMWKNANQLFKLGLAED
jgi:predicted TIM-barrel fold metal-dependent hydrolase